MKKISIALVGLGFGGAFLPIYLDHSQVSAVHILDTDPAVMEQFRSAYPEAICRSSFDEILKEGPYFKGFLFEEDENVVGFGQISFRFGSEVAGIECWFEDLYVKEAYRNKGICGGFIDYIKANFPAARYRLEVEEENVGAVALYKKKGFCFLPYKQMICDRKE